MCAQVVGGLVRLAAVALFPWTLLLLSGGAAVVVAIEALSLLVLLAPGCGIRGYDAGSICWG